MLKIFAAYNDLWYNIIVLRMNTLLETLFDKYSLSIKDRHDIRQTFSLLPPQKQQNLLNNFEVLAGRLKRIEEELYQEREILIWTALENIRAVVDRVERENIEKKSKWSIHSLKQWI